MGASDAGASGVVVTGDLDAMYVSERPTAEPADEMIDVRTSAEQYCVAQLTLRAIGKPSEKADVRKDPANFSKFNSGGRSKVAVVAVADTSFVLNRNVADGIERPLSLLRQNNQPCAQG